MITAGPGLRVAPNGSIHVQSGQGAGMVRWNNVSAQLEVWDGSTWMRLPSQHIELDSTVQDLLVWARNKIQEERKIEQMLQEHPELKELKDKYEMMRVLLTKVDNDTQS